MWRFSFVLWLLLASPIVAQEQQEVAFIKQVFTRLQPISIAENREYCGFVGYDAKGALRASKPTSGDVDSCLADDPVLIELITASYHTHGAFSRDYYNELPSGEDVEGDEEMGIDGWVATPGGRLWYIDTDSMTTSQICGLGCLPQDPAFVSGDSGIIAKSYSYDQLVRKLDE